MSRKPLGVRQGDVLLRPVPISQVRGRRVPAVDGRFTISEGEHLGHLHMLEAVPNMAVVTDGLNTFVTTDDTPTRLVHEQREGDDWVQADHDPLPVAGGHAYEVVQQRRPIFAFEDEQTRARPSLD